MTRRAPTACLVGLLALALPEARAQGRVPNFPLGVALPDGSGKNGLFWLGGDSPFGTYIGPDVSFWAFGDTFLSVPGATGRQLSGVVGNTIAIGRIVDGHFKPTYFYRGTPDRRQAFFANPGPSHKYWPKASVLVEGKLYVFLSLMYVNPGKAPADPTSSQDTGSVIARVHNPTDLPPDWRIDYIALHREDPGRQANLKLGVEVIPAPGARAVIVYGVFTNDRTKSYKAVVALVSFDALRETPAGSGVDPSQVQYLAADAANANPRWRPGFGSFAGPSDDYLNTLIDSISGFTVRWNSILAQWQVVGAFSQFAAAYPYPRGHPYTPKPVARIFVHPTPFGPFDAAPEAKSCYFFNFPELKSTEESLCCYTARQWQDLGDPRYNTDANLLFTYTFSSRDMNKALTDTSTYQNHAALVPNPFSNPSAGLTPGCADLPKIPPAPVPGTSPLADPFGAPGAPLPNLFPLNPRREAPRPG